MITMTKPWRILLKCANLLQIKSYWSWSGRPNLSQITSLLSLRPSTKLVIMTRSWVTVLLCGFFHPTLASKISNWVMVLLCRFLHLTLATWVYLLDLYNLFFCIVAFSSTLSFRNEHFWMQRLVVYFVDYFCSFWAICFVIVSRLCNPWLYLLFFSYSFLKRGIPQSASSDRSVFVLLPSPCHFHGVGYQNLLLLRTWFLSSLISSSGNYLVMCK